MNKLSKILEDNGKEAVELYRKRLKDDDRYATGETDKSIRFEVKDDKDNDQTVLTVYSSSHVRNLETGQTPSEIQSNPPMFEQIERWAIAKGVNRSAAGIINGLKLNGYEGTPGLITEADEIITNNVFVDVKRSSKMIILQDIKNNIKNGDSNS